MIGETNGVLQEALSDVPDCLTVTVERLGPYPAEAGEVGSVLTERQQEILDVATDPGTVSEHVQKIEARVFDSVTG